MPIELKPIPPKEAIEFFRQKGFKIGFDYRDVWQQEHQAAFTVAKAMNLDILKDVRGAVDDALASGTTFADFRKNLKPTLVEKGWWGKADMVDPLTNELKQVQLGSTRRLKTIFYTNIVQAQSEGQWARIQETKATFPFLKYVHGGSAHPRVQHLAWNGLVLPVDDPFWLAHNPVKAFNCHCFSYQVTDTMMARDGLKVNPSPKVQTFTYTNKRTGEVRQIPAGVDPAFHYPPGGRRAALNNFLSAKVDSTPSALAPDAVKDLVTGEAFKNYYAKPQGYFPIAVISELDAKLLGTGTQTVRLSDETMLKQQDVHPELDVREYENVQQAIEHGQRIQDAGSIVYLWQDGGYVTVVKTTKSGKALYMTSFRRLSSNQVKRDEEIKRLLRKQQPEN